jgi:hypothetical protein
VCTDYHQIHLFLPDYFFQLFTDVTLEDNYLMTHTGQRPTLSQMVLHLMSIPANRLDCLVYCIWTHQSETQ